MKLKTLFLFFFTFLLLIVTSQNAKIVFEFFQKLATLFLLHKSNILFLCFVYMYFV